MQTGVGVGGTPAEMSRFIAFTSSIEPRYYLITKNKPVDKDAYGGLAGNF